MPATLSFCLTGGKAVFLDTKHNRYFRLGGQPEALFLTFVESGPVADLDVAPLVRLGVLEPATGAGAHLNQALAPIPTRSIVEQGQTRRPSDARLTLEVGQAVVLTWAALKSSSLASVVARHKAMRPRTPVAGSLDQRASRGGDIGSLSASFNLIRRFVPIDTVCLLDSFALQRFLTRRGLRPQLVVGVRLNPFTAHCWVQEDDIVLNDAVERASTYTPILVV
jgi:hypothetical protein